MKKLLISFLALMLVLSVSLISCNKKNSGENEPDGTESSSVEGTAPGTPAETPKVEKQCTFSVKLDNGNSLSGVKITLKCGADTYELVSGADGTAAAKIVVGKYTVSYDYDTLPSGCAPDTLSFEVGADTTEILLKVVDNNPNGTLQKPFHIIENVTPLTLDAGCEVYYTCRGAMRYLTIENDGVVVTYEGTDYSPEDGKIVIPIAPELGEMAIFSIKNVTDEDLDLSVCMVFPEGSMENPIELEENDSAQASVPAGEAVYYQYVAEKNGVLVVSSEDELNNISLSNQNTYAVTSFTNGARGTYMLVSKGDEVLISVSSTDSENEAEISFAVNCYAGTEADPVPVIDDSVELSLLQDATVVFSAEAVTKVIFSGQSVTLTVGGAEHTSSGGKVTVDLAGNAGPVLFIFTNQGNSTTGLSFEME